MTLGFSDVPGVVGALGLGGAFAVFCAKGIIAFGDLRTSLRRAVAFCDRFELDFKTYQNETRVAHEEFRECFSDHNIRLEKVEFVLDLDRHAQNFVEEARRTQHQPNRRSHTRRSQDQVNDDVREMLNLPQDDV